MPATLDPSFFGIHESIILTKNGVWLSNGEEILHGGTVRAFSKNIFRCLDGFEVRLGKEKKSIHVEDTIFFVNQIEGSTEEGFDILLNDGRTQRMDASSLQYRPGRLTVRVTDPNNGTNEEAKFLSSAYYELLKFIDRDADGFCITIQQKKIILSRE